jgi:hypothetical protein
VRERRGVYRVLAKFDQPFFAHTSSLSLTEVSHAVWHGAPLEMNGGTKTGLKVQTIDGVPVGPTNRRIRIRRLLTDYFVFSHCLCGQAGGKI